MLLGRSWGEAPHIQYADHVDRWLERHGYGKRKGVVVLGGGEGSGPLYPPPVIDEDMFTADIAAELGTPPSPSLSCVLYVRACVVVRARGVFVCVATLFLTRTVGGPTAFNEAQIGPNDIDFFGLYDCFPICFIRAIEAVGLAKKGATTSQFVLRSAHPRARETRPSHPRVWRGAGHT